MPRYVQFPRSNVAGNIPTNIEPGSFAINWADRKIYTGGPNGEPILQAYRLSDFDPTRAYREQDIMYYEGSLWRCDVGFTTGTFSANQWIELTDISTAPYKELSGTVWISGGQLTLNAGSVDVAGGSGVVMNLTDPQQPNISAVSWPAFTIPAPLALNASLVVGIDGNGAAQVVDQSTLVSSQDWRRRHVLLGWITTDSAGNAVTADNVGVTQHQTRETLSDFLGIIGPFKIEGCEINLSGISTLRVASGEVFWQGLEPLTANPNVIQVPTTQPFPVARATRVGYDDTVPKAVLDVAQWDNGTVLDPVPDGSFSLQFIFLSSDRDVGVAVYGQKLYATLDAALDDVGSAWSELVRPAVTTNMILLGAVASNNDGSSQAATSSDESFGDPFGGVGGAGDTSQFLLITGTRPMTGDLDLGGNALVSGDVDGAQVNIKPIALTTSGDGGAFDPDQLVTNTTDQKVFIGADLVGSHADVYSNLRVYRVGDFAIENNNLYRCTTEVDPAETFDPAKWQLIGADNSGALTQAVIVDPTTADRNTIDVTGGGGVTAALKTTFDNSQSVDLYEFSDNARISRFGIPVGAFGEDVFRVSQVNHLFTAVGTAIYFNGAIWILADNGDQDRYPQGIVHEVIDADNFLVQVGGRVNDLDPAAFVGNVAPTAGFYYYASDTPGKLTSVEGTTPVPVLYALSDTQGIVKLTGTRQPEIPTDATIIDLVYPVGSTYLSIDPANPSLRWPGTTWEQHAEGRALVGVGNNGTSEWTVGQERGFETVALTAAQMPTHDHTFSGNTNTTGNHQHGFSYDGISPVDDNQLGDGFRQDADFGRRGTTDFAGDHSHTFSGTTSAAGSGDDHNNIQPSIGIYVWLRTA